MNTQNLITLLTGAPLEPKPHGHFLLDQALLDQAEDELFHLHLKITSLIERGSPADFGSATLILEALKAMNEKIRNEL